MSMYTRLKDVDEMSCYRGRINIKRGVRKVVWLTGVGGGVKAGLFITYSPK
jgi:hypothetical protein